MGILRSYSWFTKNCTVWRVQLARQGLVLGGEDLLIFAEITVFKELLKHLLVVPSWLHCNQIRLG